MSAKLRSASTIHIEPSSLDRIPWPCDDSTLELLLESFARRSSLADDPTTRRVSTRLFMARRFNWLSASGFDVPLRANIAQLIDDLQAEFDRLDDVLP